MRFFSTRPDNTKRLYNADDNAYWQTGIRYCSNPADSNYETLGVFVPAAYMNASDNGDGTFTCEINKESAVNGYTSMSAPIVIPVETPGYSAMSAPTAYVSSGMGTGTYQSGTRRSKRRIVRHQFHSVG